MQRENVRKQERRVRNTKRKDSSAKMIFKDPVLCAQFLTGYVDIPMLKGVKPEDIEDVSNRYVHMFTEERNSDVVKKISIRNEGGEENSFYIVSLIEHKNQVDYNVTMQILRYMVYIWEEYEKEMERRQRGISKTKNFRYPPVLPILFYDGVHNWTAATRLRDRILLSDALLRYIPDFDCILIQLKDYSNQELMKRKDELSIVMMIDKLKSAEDFTMLEKEVDPAYIQTIAENAPEYLLDIVSQIIDVLLTKLNVSEDEIEEFTGKIRERNMAELLANFKGYDVQATREKARNEGLQIGRNEGLQIGRNEGLKIGIDEGMAQGMAKGMAQGMAKARIEAVRNMLEMEIPKEKIRVKYSDEEIAEAEKQMQSAGQDDLDQGICAMTANGEN